MQQSTFREALQNLSHSFYIFLSLCHIGFFVVFILELNAFQLKLYQDRISIIRILDEVSDQVSDQISDKK